ncbi:islet cell autoantigen 1 [Pieris napi]|uniref:islet cell autoantigen 1 n=1 Tax=Pieris napi TaxID=78633 RepID=UPI001FBBA3F9|nr:islet cell autoantigen 1 [Pieris napi]
MMQHQYWVTKKTVLKKLGTKEDECIVASDAELDAKLELFQSISDSCLQLQRILDQYQERLCVLAQEENSLGKFLRDAGKSNDAAGKHMISAGKAISYTGQQRVAVRSPLLRLYHEVETFRIRAVKDMRMTVSAMEKARIEYRAALSWMKSSSAQLDPDTGRGLENFRKAQRQVKESKKIFDKLTLDVLQKIDLLAAARCNMFSHVLSNYQNSFLSVSTKVAQTLSGTIESMSSSPQYEFCILKTLSDNGNDGETKDKDQLLFFQDEYKDNNLDKSENIEKTNHNDNENQPSTAIVADSSDSLINTETDTQDNNVEISADLAGLQLGGGDMPANFAFMPSQLLQDFAGFMETPLQPQSSQNEKDKNSITQKIAQPLPVPKKEDKVAWFKLFAELDPLANPDNIPGTNNNQSHAA